MTEHTFHTSLCTSKYYADILFCFTCFYIVWEASFCLAFEEPEPVVENFQQKDSAVGSPHIVFRSLITANACATVSVAVFEFALRRRTAYREVFSCLLISLCCFLANKYPIFSWSDLLGLSWKTASYRSVLCLIVGSQLLLKSFPSIRNKYATHKQWNDVFFLAVWTILVTHFSACICFALSANVGFERSEWMLPKELESAPMWHRYGGSLLWSWEKLFQFHSSPANLQGPLEVCMRLVVSALGSGWMLWGTLVLTSILKSLITGNGLSETEAGFRSALAFHGLPQHAVDLLEAERRRMEVEKAVSIHRSEIVLVLGRLSVKQRATLKPYFPKSFAPELFEQSAPDPPESSSGTRADTLHILILQPLLARIVQVARNLIVALSASFVLSSASRSSDITRVEQNGQEEQEDIQHPVCAQTEDQLSGDVSESHTIHEGTVGLKRALSFDGWMTSMEDAAEASDAGDNGAGVSMTGPMLRKSYSYECASTSEPIKKQPPGRRFEGFNHRQGLEAMALCHFKVRSVSEPCLISPEETSSVFAWDPKLDIGVASAAVPFGNVTSGCASDVTSSSSGQASANVLPGTRELALDGDGMFEPSSSQMMDEGDSTKASDTRRFGYGEVGCDGRRGDSKAVRIASGGKHVADGIEISNEGSDDSGSDFSCGSSIKEDEKPSQEAARWNPKWHPGQLIIPSDEKDKSSRFPSWYFHNPDSSESNSPSSIPRSAPRTKSGPECSAYPPLDSPKTGTLCGSDLLDFERLFDEMDFLGAGSCIEEPSNPGQAFASPPPKYQVSNHFISEAPSYSQQPSQLIPDGSTSATALQDLQACRQDGSLDSAAGKQESDLASNRNDGSARSNESEGARSCESGSARSSESGSVRSSESGSARSNESGSGRSNESGSGKKNGGGSRARRCALFPTSPDDVEQMTQALNLSSNTSEPVKPPLRTSSLPGDWRDELKNSDWSDSEFPSPVKSYGGSCALPQMVGDFGGSGLGTWSPTPKPKQKHNTEKSRFCTTSEAGNMSRLFTSPDELPDVFTESEKNISKAETAASSQHPGVQVSCSVICDEKVKVPNRPTVLKPPKPIRNPGSSSECGKSTESSSLVTFHLPCNVDELDVVRSQIGSRCTARSQEKATEFHVCNAVTEPDGELQSTVSQPKLPGLNMSRVVVKPPIPRPKR